ncbi:MAG: CDP-glycerol glycerophosphotransferase family protein [Candidatus Saccharibacteria bacterium]|nr:CDP-glycerol glycerophosphotransferase family protein [Candidatus Saccharibacteria bacterium]
MKKLLSNLKYIKLYDIASIFIFLALILPAVIYRLYAKISKKHIWLICEDGHVARDNGYYYFRYLRTEHKSVKAYYVIDKKAHDYEKVKNFGNIIQFRSVKHWIYYISAEYNISNQKNGNPAQALFYVLHVKFGLLRNRIFLQHGITINNGEWMFYKNTKFRLITCGAKKEYEYIKENFGYPDDNVAYTGFPRFDSLIDESKGKKQILIMPTWRNWLGRETNKFAKEENFEESEYFKNWNGLINDKEFINFVEKNDIKVKFYPHINMERFLGSFVSSSKNIEIITSDTDIQEIMRRSSMMITDYSSVSMDFAYMEKPVIYFQFDQKDYREKQLKTGYFDYNIDGFGPVFTNRNKVVKFVQEIFQKDSFVELPKYLKRKKDFYDNNDRKNAARLYERLNSEYGVDSKRHFENFKTVLLFLSFIVCGLNVFTIEVGGFSVLPMMVMGAIIAILKIIIKEKKKPRITRAEIIFALLFVFIGINAIFAYDPLRSAKVLGKIVLVVFSIWEIRSLAYLVEDTSRKKAFYWASVLLLITTALLYASGLIYLGFNFDIANTRLLGVMIDRRMPRLISIASTDPNITALFLAIPFVYFMKQKLTKKNTCMLVFASVLIALTVSRGATIAIICALCTLLMFGGGKLRQRVLVALIVAISFLVSSAAVNLVMDGSTTSVNETEIQTKPEVAVPASSAKDQAFDNSALNSVVNKSTDKSIAERMSQAFSDNGSGRITLWTRTIEIFKERPINGIGQGNLFTYMKTKYKYNKYAHNTYLEMLAENGVIGITIFMFFVIALIVWAIRVSKIDASPIILLSFVLVAVLFLSVFHHEVLYILLLYIAIAHDSLKKKNDIVFVSVILPTLNTEAGFLERSIESVLKQTHKNLELIIIADGGNDEKYIKERFSDERILIIKHDKTKGVAESLNEAIAMSIGKYIIRMDADDISEKDRIEKQVAYMEENSKVAVASTFYRKFGDINTIANEPFVKPNDICAKLFYTNPIAHPTVIMKATVIKKYQYNPKYERAEDYELWQRMAIHGEKIAIIKSYVLRYRTHVGQVSTAKRNEQTEKVCKIHNYALTKLHMSEEDVRYLLMLSGQTKINNRSELKQFIKRAIRQNRKFEIYNRRAFKKVLWSGYAVACYKNKIIVFPNIPFLSWLTKKAVYRMLGRIQNSLNETARNA